MPTRIGTPGTKRLQASRLASAQPARPAQMRETNYRTLLRLIRAHSPCSKADLVRLSGLTAPTVSLAMANLAARGIVETTGDGPSSGGRPPVMLRFNAGYGYVAAADIGGTRLRMMLADLNGSPLARWDTRMTESQKDPDAVVGLMHTGLQEMKAGAGMRGRLLHLSVGAPGITDESRGVVLAAPNLVNWTDVPLRSLLQRRFGVPASVENDTNLAALGESSAGVAAGVESFIFVALGTGLGAGIVLRGALHHGVNWCAGEIGYLSVAGGPGRRISMQEPGPLESVIGGGGIEARWRDLLRGEGHAADEGLMKLRATEILDRAENGDIRAEEVLRTTARMLADALSTVALLYNPELIVLGGGVGSHRALGRVTQEFLREIDLPIPDIRSSSLGTEAQLFGAVSVALSSAETKLLC